MKAIKVCIIIHNICIWFGYLINYPTYKELSAFLPDNYSINLKQKILCSDPYATTQHIMDSDIVVGRVEIQEVFIKECDEST